MDSGKIWDVYSKQIRLRPLQLQDREELLRLHEECFPIQYESQFYDKAVEGRLFSSAVIISGAPHWHMPHMLHTCVRACKHDAVHISCVDGSLFAAFRLSVLGDIFVMMCSRVKPRMRWNARFKPTRSFAVIYMQHHNASSACYASCDCSDNFWFVNIFCYMPTAFLHTSLRVLGRCLNVWMPASENCIYTRMLARYFRKIFF